MKRQSWGPAEEPRQERVDSETDPRGSSVKGAVPPGGGMGGQTPNFVTHLLEAGICLGKPCRGVSQSHSQEPNDTSRKIRTTKESGDGESEGWRGRTGSAATLEGNRKRQIAAGK